MKGLNGKKGLILVALLMASILGAYALQYYNWTVSYTIKPLTDPLTITILPTSGATDGSDSGTLTDAIKVTKPLSKLHFMIDVDEALLDVFWDLTLEFTIEMDTVTFDLVIGGKAEIGPTDLWIGPIGAGTYDVDWTADYWTSAVDTTQTNTITVFIYAVE